MCHRRRIASLSDRCGKILRGYKVCTLSFIIGDSMATSALQKGIDAAKSGQMEEALVHLKDAIIEEPENADVWVWLSAIIEDEEKQTIFLKKALEIDPQNRPAQRGLAFIQRKKHIPPKPGEKLSDYTKPIGVFKPATALTPDQAAANVAAQSRPAPQPDPQKKTDAPEKAETAVRRRPVLDIVLYGLTLMVFIVIGILIGSTLLNMDIPFLSKPTPVLSVAPPPEGVYVLVDEQYAKMDLKLGAPESDEGIPVIQDVHPTIVVNTGVIKVDQAQLLDEQNNPLAMVITSAENNVQLIVPEDDLEPGRYCLSYAFTSEDGKALYWCLHVNP